jgi:predicted nucleic acid-binding protein
VTSAFCDTSVLIRYFAEDDVPRALAAADLIDSSTALVLSTGVILETIHVLRTNYGFDNPILGDLLIRFLSRTNVNLIDADKAGVLDALTWTQNSSARRIADALLSTAAEQADVDFIATFDEKLRSPMIQVRML